MQNTITLIKLILKNIYIVFLNKKNIQNMIFFLNTMKIRRFLIELFDNGITKPKFILNNSKYSHVQHLLILKAVKR